jgi:hypothetical protein
MDPTDGAKCDQSMETKTAADGCTVCTCDGEVWSCSSDACTPGCSDGDEDACTPDCSEGDKKVAEDGCNQCTCDADGKWDCTSDLECGDGCKAGDTNVSENGCSTCVCAGDGTWDCTEKDNCGSMVECEPGESRKADDDCNTCTCSADGQWACTLVECGATCPPPAMAPGEGCVPKPTFARDPFSSLCCEYASLCAAPLWKLFDSMDACKSEPGVSCESNHSDCDGDPTNGCEVDVLTSPENCGFCGLSCTSPAGELGKCDMGRCLEMPKPPCRYEGVDYSVGSSFPSRDGCNTCGCVSTGSGSAIACTDEACKCDPSAEGYREYAATDPEKCKALDYACPPNTRMFTNECGCGCEQGVECPSFYKCLPDGTDMAECSSLPKTCPYTEILLPL